MLNAALEEYNLNLSQANYFKLEKPNPLSSLIPHQDKCRPILYRKMRMFI